LLVTGSVWLFHRDAPIEVFAILGIFIAITVFRPLEAVARYIQWFLDRPKPINGADLIGSVAAHQSPGIVLVRQAEAQTIARGTPMVISDQHGPPQLGVALMPGQKLVRLAHGTMNAAGSARCLGCLE
jgi:uncharacterized protein